MQLGDGQVRLRLFHRGPGSFDLLPSRPRQEFREAGFGRRQARLGLVHLRRDVSGIEPNQNLALLDPIAFIGPDPLDAGGELRAELDFAAGDDVAAGGEDGRRGGRIHTHRADDLNVDRPCPDTIAHSDTDDREESGPQQKLSQRTPSSLPRRIDPQDLEGVLEALGLHRGRFLAWAHQLLRSASTMTWRAATRAGRAPPTAPMTSAKSMP